jgi:glycerol-3-phosphate dehydrogenase
MNTEKMVVVLGAGINGAAIARELLLSGVSVAVVDPGDIACGATAWSTRLVHGGLRYLEYGEFGLVRESLVERDRLVRLADHLVRPLEFYLPVQRRHGGLAAAAARLLGCESLARRWRGERGRGSWAVGIGLSLYDMLSVGSRWPRHRMVRAGLPGMPAVDASRFPFAAIYSDAQMLFPERFTVELLVDARRIAAEKGGDFRLLTRHAARLFSDGRLRAEPLRGGGHVELRPAAIVNATGAWVDRTLEALFPSQGSSRLIGGTKGSHLVLHAPRLREAVGDRAIYAEADDGRPVFVLPFGPRLVLVGTTDIPFAGDPAEARADEDEIAYLLAAAARLFPDAAPDRGQVVQHYCGVRPLPHVGAGGGLPAAVTRRHMLVRQPAGASAAFPAWSVVGGKLTTCRSLAEQAVAEVLGVLGIAVTETSRERPLPGCFMGRSRGSVEAEATRHAAAAGLADEVARRVARRTVDLFGARGALVCAAMRPAAGAPPAIIAGTDLPRAAVAWCLQEEWADTIEDIIERRLMLSFDEGLARATIADVAESFARERGVAGGQTAAEVEALVLKLRDRYGKQVV